MHLRTEIEKKPSIKRFKLNSRVVTMGSCFSDVLGNYLISNKINCLANPFGTVFNLESISKIIINAINHTALDDKYIIESDQIFYHYDLHSSICANNIAELKATIKTKQNELHNRLKAADFLIITLGTSWIYRLINTETIVSNCHKQPSNLFKKELLNLDKQFAILKNLQAQLLQFNPNLRLILTVSPVRHLKDMLELNSISKSILRVLCHESLKFDNIDYFGSYEIMMDDLRDYRFYKSDLIHPSELAEKYILQNFSANYFEHNLQKFIEEWAKIKLAINHRPFNAQTQKHQLFLRNLLQKLEYLSAKINVNEEMAFIKNQIV